MGGARFGDPSPPHQLRDAGRRDVWTPPAPRGVPLMFLADGALPAPRKQRRWWPLGKLTEYPLWEVAGAPSGSPALAPRPPRPLLEGLVGIALSGDVAARPPLFCLHHFVDHRPKIPTGFVP